MKKQRLLKIVQKADNGYLSNSYCVSKDYIVMDSHPIKNKGKKITESGRSMVEMLGVLAIIGVLSIGAVAGYKFALNKFRANEIINELNARALSVSAQMLSATTPYESDEVIEDGFGNTLAVGYSAESAVSSQNPEYFEITINGIPSEVCTQILRDYENPIMIFVNEVRYNNDTSLCTTESGTVDMGFIYRRDLGERETCSERGYFGEEDFICHCAGNTYIDPNNPNECLCPAGHVWSADENTCIESICDEGYFESSQYGCIPCSDERAVTTPTTRQQKSCNACPNRYYHSAYQYCINDTQCTLGESVTTMVATCVECSTDVISIGGSGASQATKDSCLACKPPYEKEIIDGVCVSKGKCTGSNGQMWYYTVAGTYACASCETNEKLWLLGGQGKIAQCNACVNSQGIKNRKVVGDYCVKSVCDTGEFMGADGTCYSCTSPLSVAVNENSGCLATTCNRSEVQKDGKTYCQISDCPTGTHVQLDDGSCYDCSLNNITGFLTDSETERNLCVACESPNERHVMGDGKCMLKKATLGKTFYYKANDAWFMAECGNTSKCFPLSMGSVEAEYCEACTDRYIKNYQCCIDNKTCTSSQFSSASSCKDCTLMEKVRVDTEYQKSSCLSCTMAKRFWAGEYCYHCNTSETPDVITDDEIANCVSCGRDVVDGKCILKQ